MSDDLIRAEGQAPPKCASRADNADRVHQRSRPEHDRSADHMATGARRHHNHHSPAAVSASATKGRRAVHARRLSGDGTVGARPLPVVAPAGTEAREPPAVSQVRGRQPAVRPPNLPQLPQLPHAEVRDSTGANYQSEHGRLSEVNGSRAPGEAVDGRRIEANALFEVPAPATDLRVVFRSPAHPGDEEVGVTLN